MVSVVVLSVLSVVVTDVVVVSVVVPELDPDVEGVLVTVLDFVVVAELEPVVVAVVVVVIVLVAVVVAVVRVHSPKLPSLCAATAALSTATVCLQPLSACSRLLRLHVTQRSVRAVEYSPSISFKSATVLEQSRIPAINM